MKMTQKHKDFILNKLCPAILREEGRGFAMEEWHDKTPEGVDRELDGVERKAPKCGTICCIGGTAEMLFAPPTPMSSWDVGNAMGLSEDQSDALFFEWRGDGKDVYGVRLAWPRELADAYAEAETTLAKAEVAVRLLHLVVETEGRCLEGV